MRLPPHCREEWYQRAPAWVRWLFDCAGNPLDDHRLVDAAAARDLARWFRLPSVTTER